MSGDPEEIVKHVTDVYCAECNTIVDKDVPCSASESEQPAGAFTTKHLPEGIPNQRATRTRCKGRLHYDRKHSGVPYPAAIDLLKKRKAAPAPNPRRRVRPQRDLESEEQAHRQVRRFRASNRLCSVMRHNG